MTTKDIRIETDFIGSKELPQEAYYGIQTIRGMENFKVTGQSIDSQFIIALGMVKKAAAKANMYACSNAFAITLLSVEMICIFNMPQYNLCKFFCYVTIHVVYSYIILFRNYIILFRIYMQNCNSKLNYSRNRKS